MSFAKIKDRAWERKSVCERERERGRERERERENEMAINQSTPQLMGVRVANSTVSRLVKGSVCANNAVFIQENGILKDIHNKRHFCTIYSQYNP